MLPSICQQIWKTQQWPQDQKRSVFIPIPKKGNAKECSNYHTTALISHASKILLKILQARLQQYVNRELPDVQAGFRKGRRTRDQIANIRWIIKKAREFQKNIYFCFIALTSLAKEIDKLQNVFISRSIYFSHSTILDLEPSAPIQRVINLSSPNYGNTLKFVNLEIFVLSSSWRHLLYLYSKGKEPITPFLLFPRRVCLFQGRKFLSFSREKQGKQVSPYLWGFSPTVQSPVHVG